MNESFAEMLSVGGKTNSLGRAAEIIEIVLGDKHRLDELYRRLFVDDAWIRMRAADTLEKICRVHPEWLAPYTDRFRDELAISAQPSIQWHLAQIYRQLPMTMEQKSFAVEWLTGLISTVDVDWIVASNAMDTLMQFTRDGSLPVITMQSLLEVQQQHRSNAVKKRAAELLASLSPA